MVIGDWDGLDWGFLRKIEFINEVSFLEALARKEGTQFSRDIYLKNICVEGDSKVVMNTLKCASNAPSYLHLLVNDTLNISKDFSFVSFSWIPRIANYVAHSLVHFGKSISKTEYWIKSIPFFHITYVLCIIVLEIGSIIDLGWSLVIESLV